MTTSVAVDTETFRRRGRYDEKKHKRGKGGRFARKAVKSLLDPRTERRIKNTPSAQVFARHDDGDVTHVSEDGNSRLVYDGSSKRFTLQQKDDNGDWQDSGSLGKLQAFRQVSRGWRVADDQDQGPGARAVSADDGNDGNDTASAPDAAPPAAPDDFAAPPAAFPARTPADMATVLPDAAPRTPEQQAAIRSYSVTGYQDMNGCLRTGQNCDPDVTQRNADLESAMTTSTEPMTTHRAMTLANLAGGVTADQLASLVGQEISDPGFTSTTLDPAQTAIFGAEQDSVDLEIEMPAGTRALFSGADASIPEEQAVILPPGTRYRVLEANNPGPPGRPSIRIQVIP
jgi:hypothetical protein